MEKIDVLDHGPANYDEADAWAGWRWAQSLYPGGIPAPQHLWRKIA